MDLRNPKQIRREYIARLAAIALGFAIAAVIGVTVTKASGHEIARQTASNCGAC